MQTLAGLASMLACPLCEGDLQSQADGLACTSCAQDYPNWGGLPWMFAAPEKLRLDWGHRLSVYLQSMQRDIELLKIEQKIPALLPTTLDRLRLLIQAKTEQLREIEKLFHELTLPEGMSYDLHQVAGTPLPEQQSLLGYYANIMRDWAWGSSENDSAAQCVIRALGEQAPGLMVVLGSGPSRLAYDVHRYFPGTTTLAVDINPFYLLIASRLISGKNLHLYNFPIAPKDLKSTALRLKCKAPESLKEGFHFLLADARTPCFRQGSIQTLLTPWLIDVIPQDFRIFARRMNRILQIGGCWVNFGSLVFHQSLQHLRYSREEVIEILEASGFCLESREDLEIPYLHDPQNCQKRDEWIFCFRARKVREVELIDDENLQKIPWIDNPREPIPAWSELSEQLFTHHTLAVILAHVNGERSISDIAKLLAPQLNVAEDQAQLILQRVLSRAYDQRLKSRSF